MNILVCGGRNYKNKEKLFKVLDLFLPEPEYDEYLQQIPPSLIIIQGGATGADALAREWSDLHRIDGIEHPAEWDKYGKAAGPIRNTKMINDGYGVDLVIAFKGGAGTKDLINKALVKGIIVLRVEE